MAAPADIETYAAELLTRPVEDTGLYFVEGPGQYSSDDVGAAMSEALNRKVEVVEVWSGTTTGHLISAYAIKTFSLYLMFKTAAGNRNEKKKEDLYSEHGAAKICFNTNSTVIDPGYGTAYTITC